MIGETTGQEPRKAVCFMGEYWPILAVSALGLASIALLSGYLVLNQRFAFSNPFHSDLFLNRIHPFFSSIFNDPFFEKRIEVWKIGLVVGSVFFFGGAYLFHKGLIEEQRKGTADETITP